MMDTRNVGNNDGVLPKGTIVYKKCMPAPDRSKPKRMQPSRVIVELIVLEDGVVPRMARTTIGRRKCRVPLAFVSRILLVDGSPTRRRIAHSLYQVGNDRGFRYEVGKIVKPRKKFDDNPLVDCTSGIHVYRTLEEAQHH